LIGSRRKIVTPTNGRRRRRKPVAEDRHAGRSGAVTKDNVYTLKVDQVVPGVKYLLRVKSEDDNGNDSQGRIQFKKA
jgi:hypothetical protein